MRFNQLRITVAMTIWTLLMMAAVLVNVGGLMWLAVELGLQGWHRWLLVLGAWPLAWILHAIAYDLMKGID